MLKQLCFRRKHESVDFSHMTAGCSQVGFDLALWPPGSVPAAGPHRSSCSILHCFLSGVFVPQDLKNTDDVKRQMKTNREILWLQLTNSFLLSAAIFAAWTSSWTCFTHHFLVLMLLPHVFLPVAGSCELHFLQDTKTCSDIRTFPSRPGAFFCAVLEENRFCRWWQSVLRQVFEGVTSGFSLLITPAAVWTRLVRLFVSVSRQQSSAASEIMCSCVEPSGPQLSAPWFNGPSEFR